MSWFPCLLHQRLLRKTHAQCLHNQKAFFTCEHREMCNVSHVWEMTLRGCRVPCNNSYRQFRGRGGGYGECVLEAHFRQKLGEGMQSEHLDEQAVGVQENAVWPVLLCLLPRAWWVSALIRNQEHQGRNYKIKIKEWSVTWQGDLREESQ